MVKRVLVNKRVLNTVVSFLIFITMLMSVSAQDYLALQGSAAGAGRGMSGSGTQGNITIEIWSTATGGSLLYNSTSDFWGALNNSRYDILLGNGSQPLSLNFSNTYYMEIYINERELDFNGTERQVFQSPVGNITVANPIKTTSSSTYALNVNDRFNVSGASGDTTVSGVVNITGATTLSGATTVANFFNVTPTTSTIRTNGTVTIESVAVPAFTVNGGFNISGAGELLKTNGTISIQNPSLTQAFTVNNGFNISGTDEAVRTNGTVTITNTDADGALNITGGLSVNTGSISGAVFRLGIFGFEINEGGGITTQNNIGQSGNVIIRSIESQALSVNEGFNVTGPAGILKTNGTISIQNPSLAQAFTVNNGFNISGTNEALRTNGTVTIESVAVPAFTVNGGFNISGAGELLKTNGTISIQNPSLTQAFTVNNGFNISGTDEAVRTNGTVTILNNDGDDALNVTGAIYSSSSIFTTNTFISTASATSIALDVTGMVLVGNFFNITPTTSAVRTNGTVTILNIDSDDALNVTGASIFKDKVFISGPIPDPIFTVNNGFNISASNEALRTNGTVTVINSDTDDALNVTGSIAQQGAVHIIGNAESTTQHHIDVYDGGTDKCGYIRLFDDAGADWFLFANSTGQLRMFSDAPTGAGQCNTGGNGVGGQPN